MSSQGSTRHPSTSGRDIPVGHPVAIPTECVRGPLCRPYDAAHGPNRDGTPPVFSGVIRILSGGFTPALQAGGKR
jgi:hypothetical protein